MKLLNLDEVSPVKRQVTLRGTTYNVRQSTVQQMLDAIRISSRSQVSEEGPGKAEQVMNDLVNVCSTILENCPVEVLRSMTMDQMRALIEFANAPDEEVVAGSESPSGGQVGGEDDGKKQE